MPQTFILIVFTFALNIFLSVRGVWLCKASFSLNKIFWLFSLFFLSLIPLLQFTIGQFPWQRPLSFNTILYANCLILIYQILYAISYSKFRGCSDVLPQNKPYNVDKKKAIFVFVLSSIISIIFTNKGQFWIRTNGIDIKNSSLQLLADKGLKGICLVGWLAILNLWQSKKVSTQNFVLLFLLGTMAQFPTAAPRYWVATYHLPLLLIGAKKTFEKHRHLFETSFSVLILVLFPIMSLFRYGLQIFSDKKTTLQSIYRLSFLGGDFDAYSSLCTTIDYVQTKGITWGKQLATVFLFFVPRSWWPGKSVGSGALVNDLPGSDFKNFSSPFIAEGYINFGFGGIVIFVVIISFLNKKYDSYNQSNLRQNDFLQMFYPAALALFFFLLRGDLLSSFAYSVGIFVAAWVCNKILLQKPSTIV